MTDRHISNPSITRKAIPRSISSSGEIDSASYVQNNQPDDIFLHGKQEILDIGEVSLRGRVDSVSLDVDTRVSLISYTQSLNVERSLPPFSGQLRAWFLFILTQCQADFSSVRAPDLVITVPGWNDNVWSLVSSVFTTYGLDFSASADGEITISFMSESDEVSLVGITGNGFTEDVRRGNTSQHVEISYYNHRPFESQLLLPFDNDYSNVIQVDADEYLEVTQELNAWASEIFPLQCVDQVPNTIEGILDKGLIADSEQAIGQRGRQVFRHSNGSVWYTDSWFIYIAPSVLVDGIPVSTEYYGSVIGRFMEMPWDSNKVLYHRGTYSDGFFIFDSAGNLIDQKPMTDPLTGGIPTSMTYDPTFENFAVADSEDGVSYYDAATFTHLGRTPLGEGVLDTVYDPYNAEIICLTADNLWMLYNGFIYYSYFLDHTYGEGTALAHDGDKFYFTAQYDSTKNRTTITRYLAEIGFPVDLSTRFPRYFIPGRRVYSMYFADHALRMPAGFSPYGSRRLYTLSPASLYAVAGQDMLGIRAAEWLSMGGDVQVEIGEEPGTVLFKVQSASDVSDEIGSGIKSSYRIAETSGNYYSSIRLVGSGVEFDKKSVLVATGEPASITTANPQQIDNSAVSSLEQALFVAQGVLSTDTSGVSRELTVGTSNFNETLNRTFLQDDTRWRINSCASSPEGSSLKAEEFSNLGDLEDAWTGLDLNSFHWFWEGRSLGDLALRPLRSWTAEPPVHGYVEDVRSISSDGKGGFSLFFILDTTVPWTEGQPLISMGDLVVEAADPFQPALSHGLKLKVNDVYIDSTAYALIHDLSAIMIQGNPGMTELIVSEPDYELPYGLPVSTSITPRDVTSFEAAHILYWNRQLEQNERSRVFSWSQVQFGTADL